MSNKRDFGEFGLVQNSDDCACTQDVDGLGSTRDSNKFSLAQNSDRFNPAQNTDEFWSARKRDNTYCFRLYLKDRLAQVGAVIVTLFSLAGMLVIFGLEGHPVIAAVVCVFLGFLFVFVVDYGKRRRYYRSLEELTRTMQQVSHFHSMVKQPHFLEGELCNEALDHLFKLAQDELIAAQEINQSYSHYVNTWVHEVKTPLAAAKLILARMKGVDATSLRKEVESIERQVEQILYYSRSASLSKDFLIRKTNLLEVVQESCKRNQNLLISSGVSPVIEVDRTLEVVIDKAWLIFVVSQLVVNCAKYGAKRITFSAIEKKKDTLTTVLLEVKDDGWGIPAEDMPRIFQQGYVGKNGRSEGSATGMGLYLCACLCEAMGLSLEVYSEEGVGTRVVIGISYNQVKESMLTAL